MSELETPEESGAIRIRQAAERLTDDDLRDEYERGQGTTINHWALSSGTSSADLTRARTFVPLDDGAP